MKISVIKATCAFLAVIMCFSAFAFSFTAAEVKAEDATSVTSENAYFTLDIEAPATAIKGETISVFITVNDIQQELNAVEFHLTFDPTKVKGVIQGKTNVDANTTEEDPLNDLMNKAPTYTAEINGVETSLSRYEQIVKYDETGKYECKFVDLLRYPNAKDGQEFTGLKSGELVIKIDFEVLDTVSLEDKFVFSTVDGTVKGTTREGFNRVYGYAKDVTTTVAKIPEWAGFELDIKSTPAAPIGYNVDVVITIKNIKQELFSVEFDLSCNDHTMLTYESVETSNPNFETTTPENGVHSFKFSANPEEEENGLINNGDLVVTIKFRILDTANIDDKLEFSIVNKTAKATTGNTSEEVLGYTPHTAVTTVEEQGTVSGLLGELAWVLDKDYTLTVSGTGEMEDFGSFSETPWNEHQKRIAKVVIEDGITSISAHAFEGCSAITSIWISKTVIKIGNYSFDGCTELEHVYYGGSLREWYKISVGTNNEPLRNATIHFSHTHKWSEWKFETAPPYEEEGSSIRTCLVCGAKEQIAHTEHTEGEWVIVKNVTPDKAGLKELHCSVCDKVLKTKDIPITPSEEIKLKFTSTSLTLQDDLVINYKVDKSLIDDNGYKTPYVVFNLNGVKTVVKKYKVVENKYVFDFTNIIPHQMNDTVYATLYATYNGVVYNSNAFEYSVSTYCYNMLEKCSSDEYAEFRTLLVDLLNYGSASQEYMKYKEGNLANANLTSEQKEWGTGERVLNTVQDVNYKTIDTPTVSWESAGLNLEESIGLRFKIQADDIEGLTVKVETSVGEMTIDSSKFTIAKEGGYYVFVEGMHAGQMSENVYVTVYKDSVAVSNTLQYSIESYAYSMQNDSDETLGALVKAMMKYGDSAKAYIS